MSPEELKNLADQAIKNQTRPIDPIITSFIKDKLRPAADNGRYTYTHSEQYRGVTLYDMQRELMSRGFDVKFYDDVRERTSWITVSWA